MVWLPTQLAKLSDREGGFAQTLLQGISLSIYKRLPLEPELARFVDPIWEQLPMRDHAETDVQLERVNFFRPDAGWLMRRRHTLGVVGGALAAVASGSMLGSKVVSTRYGDGL